MQLTDTQREVAAAVIDFANSKKLRHWFSQLRTGKTFVFKNLEEYLKTARPTPTIEDFEKFIKDKYK